jgi:hypothetical protein
MLGYRRNINNNNTSITNSQITQILNALDVNDVGQTFFEIITQQPYKFAKNDISLNSSSIILRWNYDSIIAKHDNNNIAKLANIFDYTQNLPFIDTIIIDISGFVGTYNNINYNIYNYTWINITSITISGDYNVSSFKQYIFQRADYNNPTNISNILINNIINNAMPFSIRIYGENYSNDYPNIETRSLVFNNLSFLNANIPSTPLFIESNTSYAFNANNISLTYFNTLSDISNTSSSAYLSNYSIDYSLNDILVSSSLVKTNNGTINNSFASNIYSNSNFNITLTNLLSGASYNHRVKVRNNFSNSFSNYSTLNGSKYTLLPNNANIGTFIDMTIKTGCYRLVSTNILNNSNILYFNIANVGHSFRFNNSSIQEFQITHPYFSNQQLESYRYGYGKFIDNSFNLVTINLRINNVEKHSINYGGFNTNPNLNPSINPYNYSKTDYGSDFILNNINNNNIRDIYSDFSNTGFRLKGYLLLKDEITNTNIVNYFGNPSTNPYIMNFNYTRSTSVGNSYGINKTYDIYVDNLVANPSISNISSSIVIQEVIYNMGVASVKYFKLLLTRIYSNINSNYKYIVGDRKIANLTSSNNIVTSFSGADIILPQIDICANGVYNYDLCYNIAYYQPVRNNISFNLLEKAYNLNGFTSLNISLTSKPYCDYNSFIKSNNIISSSKLNLSALHIYEISNIELLGSDLNAIELKHYNNHSANIAPCTLLYLDSSFNNIFGTYPKSSDFSYNNLDISYNTHGNTSYNLNGVLLTNNQGYKWIVFKIYKNSSGTNSYLFNAISYSISTTSDGNNIKYLPLKTMLKNSNLFLNSIVDNIFNVTNNDALMFGHATTINSNKRYFNIKINFNGLGGIWTENSNSNNISYNSTTNSIIYGSNVNSEGIYCPINNLNDDLTIYIGLKELIL